VKKIDAVLPKTGGLLVNLTRTSAIQAANKAIHATLLESPPCVTECHKTLLRVNRLQVVEIHFEMWPTTLVPGLITDTMYN